MEKKVLIINASPRKHGSIASMLEAMREEAVKLGAFVEVINVSDLQIKPCTGCMACRSRLACVLPEDDAQQTLRQIENCDAMIIGAPCYWGNMPGHLKLLFDRMVYGLMGESKWGFPRPLHKGKRAILVSTSTTMFPFNIWFNQTRGVIKALKEILKWSGFRVCAVIERGGTKHKPIGEKDLNRCRKAVRCILK